MITEKTTKDAVLYVDDEIANLTVFKYAFRKYYEVFTAQSAVEGMEILRQNYIKVIISDQRMPEISGIEFLVQTCSEFPEAIRVILTGFTDIEVIIKAINEGRVYRYITKPWNNDELRITIDNAIESYDLHNERKRLISDLTIANQKLAETNKTLEEKVMERTQQIMQQNEVITEKATKLELLNEEITTQSENLMKANEEITAATNALMSQNEKLKQAYKNLEILSDIGKKITANLDSFVIFNTVYENICKLMEVDAFYIGLYRHLENALYFPSGKEFRKDIQPFTINLNVDNFANWCFKNQKEIMLNQSSKEYSAYLSYSSQIFTFESMIYIPLYSKFKLIGIITIHAVKEFAYSEYHLNILRNIAVYTSIALDNSETYKQIENQKLLIEQKSEDIRASIRYAQTIQSAVLPEKDMIDSFFESFIVYKPKDIVSGDFYWFADIFDEKINAECYFIAVVDCTGHGVPGAFMSLIGNRLLNAIVIEHKIVNPVEILELLDVGIKSSLKQEQTDIHDGMDICLCRIDKLPDHKNKISFAGARRPLLYYSQATKELTILKGTKKSIGGLQFESAHLLYNGNELELQDGDILYLTTDGFSDQNSADLKRYGTARFLKLLQSIVHLPLKEQMDALETALFDFKRAEEQRDDVTIIGLKL